MSRSLPPSPGPTSVRQESEASAAIISGFVAWLLLQALLTATEMLADSAPGPVARAVLLSVLIVSFQTQRFHAYGARYWFPASVGAFELLRSPMSGAGPVTFLFVALWMAMPWLLCSLKLEGRLRTLGAGRAALDVREVLRRPNNELFTTGTVAVEVGEELWVGSFRGDRIAIVPAE